LEVSEKDSAMNLRDLLSASVNQGRTFAELDQSDPDLSRVFSLASHAANLYVRADRSHLAMQMWFDISERLQQIELFATAADAAKLGVLTQFVAGATYPIETSLGQGGGHNPLFVRYPRLGADSSARTYDAALVSRFKDYAANCVRIRPLHQSLLNIQSDSTLVQFGGHGMSPHPFERGSFAWATQRLASDLLPGLLSDMAAFRATGFPMKTGEAIEAALRASTVVLVQKHDIWTQNQSPAAAITRFTAELRNWSEIAGDNADALSSRDRIWRNLLILRKRLSRTIAKIQWDHISVDREGNVPSAGTVISPFVEVVTDVPILVETTVAVSRIVKRFESSIEGEILGG
jgi:hypothetical protein